MDQSEGDTQTDIENEVVDNGGNPGADNRTPEQIERDRVAAAVTVATSAEKPPREVMHIDMENRTVVFATLGKQDQTWNPAAITDAAKLYSMLYGFGTKLRLSDDRTKTFTDMCDASIPLVKERGRKPAAQMDDWRKAMMLTLLDESKAASKRNAALKPLTEDEAKAIVMKADRNAVGRAKNSPKVVANFNIIRGADKTGPTMMDMLMASAGGGAAD